MPTLTNDLVVFKLMFLNQVAFTSVTRNSHFRARDNISSLVESTLDLKYVTSYFVLHLSLMMVVVAPLLFCS